jgi:cell division protein FtsL
MSAVESWFAPAAAAVAKPLPVAQPRRRPATQAVARKPKTRARSGSGFRVRGSLVWMVVFAVLLVGVVAVNIAVLRAHVSANDLDKKIAQLQQGNASLASQYSSMTAPPRIEAAARRDGLIPAPGLDVQLLNMASGR